MIKIEQKNKINIKEKVPTIAELSQRFYFIDDNILKINISIAFQYIISLIVILDELNAENTTISSSIYKDMILYTATIIEGCLHFCLKKYIKSDVIKDSNIMPTNWDLKESKDIYKISDEKFVCGAIKYKKTEHLSNNTNFVVINKACQNANILSKDLFIKAEAIREMRNKIHVSGLNCIEDSYAKKDAQKAFETAKAIIDIVEEKLNNLNKK